MNQIRHVTGAKRGHEETTENHTRENVRDPFRDQVAIVIGLDCASSWLSWQLEYVAMTLSRSAVKVKPK